MHASLRTVASEVMSLLLGGGVVVMLVKLFAH
jgi:hypothetical protein